MSSKITKHLQDLLVNKSCLMCKHYTRPCIVSSVTPGQNIIHGELTFCNKLEVIQPFNANQYFHTPVINPVEATACKGVNFEKGGLNWEYLGYLENILKK